MRQRIRRRTPQRAAQDRDYNREVKAWLQHPENEFCVVAALLFWGRLRATQCHHQRGRRGPLLLDKRWWIPVSAKGHQWIENNPTEARALGLIAGPWNTQPAPSVPGLNIRQMIEEARKRKNVLRD